MNSQTDNAKTKNAERQRRYRQRKKEEADRNVTVTSRNAPREEKRREENILSLKNPDVTIPSSVDTPEIRAAFERWADARELTPEPLYRNSDQEQTIWIQIAGWNSEPDLIVQALNQAASGGWKNLKSPQQLNIRGPRKSNGAHSSDFPQVSGIVKDTFYPDANNVEDVKAKLTPEQFKAAQVVGLKRIALSDQWDKDTPAAYAEARKATV